MAAVPPQHHGHDRRGAGGAAAAGDRIRRFPVALQPGRPQPDAIYSPPQSLHFFSKDGFHLIPFTNPVDDRDRPATFAAVTKVDTETLCQPEFLGRGWPYRLFGLPLDRHLLAAPPNCAWNILGTDRDGRDVLSRLLVGSQLTMSIALIVVLSVTLGTIVGIVSGYLGGVADHWIQRGVEFFLAVPEVPFYFALVAIVPRNLSPFQLMLVICAILSTLRWAHLAREVRGKTLSIASSTMSRRPRRSAPAAGASSCATSCPT